MTSTDNIIDAVEMCICMIICQQVWQAVKVLSFLRKSFLVTILPYSGEEPFGQQLAQIDGKHFVENQVEAVQIVGEAK